MTTIAYDGKVLVVDRQVTYQAIGYKCDKLFATPLGLAAIGGSANSAMAIIRWLCETDRNIIEYPVMSKDDNASVVIVAPDKHLILYDSDSSTPLELPCQMYVEGSGGHIAYGAMLAGKNAVAAMQIAIKADINSGNGYSVGNVVKGTIKHYD